MAHIIGNVTIPKNCYSIYDIARYENISKDKIEKLMQATLKNAMNIVGSNSSSAVKAYFNDNGRYDSTINLFTTHSKLRPFAKAIKIEFEKCFAKNTKHEIQFAMFYIKKEHYENWKKYNKEYNDAIADDIKDGTEKAASFKQIRMPLTDEFNRFQQALKNMKIKVADGIGYAISEYMTNHSEYFTREKNEYADERKVRENKISLIWAYINPETVNMVYKALQRYNQLNAVNIRFSDFVESALNEKLDRLPMKYTDPELYKEAMELEKEEKRVYEAILRGENV